MTPQEIENDRLMHHHAFQICRLPSRTARLNLLSEIGNQYGTDWQAEVRRRVEIKWQTDKEKPTEIAQQH